MDANRVLQRKLDATKKASNEAAKQVYLYFLNLYSSRLISSFMIGYRYHRDSSKMPGLHGYYV